MHFTGQLVDRCAQRRSPILLGRRVLLDLAAARRPPAFHAMRTTPRCRRDEVNRLRGRILRERGGKIAEPDFVGIPEPLNHGRQRLVATLVMVAERFAVDGNRRDRAGRRPLQGIGPAVGIGLQAAEGDWIFVPDGAPMRMHVGAGDLDAILIAGRSEAAAAT